MARWRKGEEQVTYLIEQRHLQRVAADPDIAGALVASARRHVESAHRTADNDPKAAYSLAYDAARKSATALLSHQGLRPQPRAATLPSLILCALSSRECLAWLPWTGSAGAAKTGRHDYLPGLPGDSGRDRGWQVLSQSER